MIIFTAHALKRLRERGISKTQAAETVQNPETEAPEEENIKLFQKEFGDKTLEVVAEIKRNKITIITLYWL